MDVGGATATASVESTVLPEKTTVTQKKTEKEVTSSDKNGSGPDSTVVKEIASEVDQSMKSKDALKQCLEDNATKMAEQTNKEDEQTSPNKQVVTTTASPTADVKKDKLANNLVEAASSSSQGEETPAMQDDENDDLLLRLEALEKGEDPELIGLDRNNEHDENHQNGLVEKSTAETPAKSRLGSAEANENVEMSPASTEAMVKETTPKKSVCNENTLATSKGESSLALKSTETVSSNAKRKHALSEPETNTEPQIKKVHVGDVTDRPEAAAKKTATVETHPSPAKESPRCAPSASSVEAPTMEVVDSMEESAEKPPSVEKMDVDGSPEPETSSQNNLETLPDTEPNTEPEDKLEEISSSVAEEPTRTDAEDKTRGKLDHSNVSSSDDKRTGSSETTKLPDSEVSASVVPTPSEDEAMDVDEDDTDITESSTLVGGKVPVPVVEPLCVKKVAYLCTDGDTTDAPQKDVKKSPAASPAKPVVASTSTVVCATTAPSTTHEKVCKVQVESPTKARSSSMSAVKSVGQSEAVVVDSSKPSGKPSSPSTTNSTTVARTLVESVVESSQPSSSSDSKQQQSDNRLNDQLREAVKRGGLLAKATSTPNSSAAMATSSPLTPKTLNSVTTSAVSSSNVYSSTPIHANFMKVASGNVSTITNPPSSVETSRVEADDTTAPNIDHSASIVVAGEGKQSSSSTATASTSKSSISVTPSKGETSTVTVSPAVKSSPPKKDPLKREQSYSTSSSSLKSTDSSEVDSCTAASAMNTAEEISMYKTNARKFNGISSTSEGSELDIKEDVVKSLNPGKVEADSKVSLSSTVPHLDLSGAISPSTSAEQQYEVSVWYDGKDLQFLSVERIHGSKVESSTFDSCTTAGTTAVTQDTSSVIDSSSKQSSTTNGSVSSFGPFKLAEKPASLGDPAAHSSDSSSTSATATVVKPMTSTVPLTRRTVAGPRLLCEILIREFTNLRRTFAPDEDGDSQQYSEVDEQLLSTPKTSGSARGQRSGSGASKKGATPRGQKRSKVADSDEDDDVSSEQRTPRATGSSATKQSAKKLKSGESPTVTSTATPKPKPSPEQKQQFDICCLARWTDRKYYAGRVTNFRGDNKYVVVFEDGCSKTLSRDIIVFGEDGVLPILNHSIHALTGGDTYEPAIVEEIKRSANSGDVVYAVRTASSALEVTATDIYLTDEQAKWIHNALKDKPDPMQQLLQSESSAQGADHATGDGLATDGVQKGDCAPTPEHGTDATGDKNARSTRSKRGASDKSMTPITPEAGYSGGVGKKGRRGRRKQLPPPESNPSECSDVSDAYEDEVPTPVSPETGLDAVDGVQPELQRTEQESELHRMMLISQYFDDLACEKDQADLDQLLGPIPVSAKTLFRNKHFLLSCTIPLKISPCNGDSADASKYRQFSNIPFVKHHLRRQIEAGGGKVYQFFEDVPKNKYKLCKLIAPRPSTTALYVQCLACDIPAVSHEWIIQCCQVLMLVDYKPYGLPSGWSFLERRYIDWGCGRSKDKRNSTNPFTSTSINVASLCNDFNDFWSRVCKLGGATVRLIKTESDVTENLTGYLLTDQEFPEEIKIKAARNGLLVVSTVWVVQCLIVGRVCHPKSHEKLTQIYQEDDY